ncbi:MAG: NUDIX hydrolase [Acidobacteriia bacterium]|nr:NUDIX hydrolase [Terriglobia bacterium]
MKRDYPDRPIVGVGAVVVDGERALVVRRATEPLKGEWSIPGGMLELGEKLREGIVREVREETGLDVEVFDVLDVFDSIFPDREGRTQYHYVLIDFLCRPMGGELQASSDVSEAKWVTAEEAGSLQMKAATVGVIRKALGLTGQMCPSSVPRN